MNVRDQDRQAIGRLWGELAEFPASQSSEALRHCLGALARQIGAANAFWVGACRDGVNAIGGWRPHGVTHLTPSAEIDRRVAELAKHMRGGDFDPQTRAIVACAGKTRAFLRPELVETNEWRRCWLYNDLLRPLSIEDRLLGAHALNPYAESYLGFDRDRRSRAFGDRERDVLALFLAGAPAFHREQLLSRGPIARKALLSKRERDVLELLLTDATPREIAAALGLTWRTTHQYVVAVLRKFGVKGRVGLMAHWLRHQVTRFGDTL